MGWIKYNLLLGSTPPLSHCHSIINNRTLVLKKSNKPSLRESFKYPATKIMCLVKAIFFNDYTLKNVINKTCSVQVIRYANINKTHLLATIRSCLKGHM